MPNEFVESKIQELVKQKDWRRLKEILSGWPAPDIADLFENIREQDVVILNKNETRPCSGEQPLYHYPFRCHRFIGLFFDSKMVAEVLIIHKILCI